MKRRDFLKILSQSAAGVALAPSVAQALCPPQNVSVAGVMAAAPNIACIPQAPGRWATPTPVQLPIVPLAAGFGMNTVAGSGRAASARGGNNAGSGTTILFVDSRSVEMRGTMDPSGTFGYGTLSWCCASLSRGGAPVRGARTVIPLVSGTVVYAPGSMIRVAANTTVAMQCAPSPGLYVTGAEWRVDGSNVLLWHCTSFYPGHYNSSNRSCFGTQASSTANYAGVIFANCTGAWNNDEGTSFYSDPGVTASGTVWQHLQFEPPYDKSPEYLSYESIGRGAVASESAEHVCWLRCLWAHTVIRNPYSRAQNAMIADNIVYNPGHSGAYIGTPGSVNGQKHNIVSNVYLAGPNTNNNPWLSVTGAIYVQSGAGAPYVHGNASVGVTPMLKGVTTDSPYSSCIVDGYTPRNFGFGANISSATVAQVREQVELVCSTAGARPRDRLPQARAVVNQVLAKATGKTTGLGSWVTSVVDRTRMTLAPVPETGISVADALNTGAIWGSPVPLANRNKITSSGYTVLEEWLHARHAAVM